MDEMFANEVQTTITTPEFAGMAWQVGITVQISPVVPAEGMSNQQSVPVSVVAKEAQIPGAPEPPKQTLMHGRAFNAMSAAAPVVTRAIPVPEKLIARQKGLLTEAYTPDPAVLRATPASAASASTQQAVVQNVEDEEVVAVISAAVAAVMGDASYAITGITPSDGFEEAVRRGARPVWAFVGMQENVRPF